MSAERLHEVRTHADHWPDSQNAVLAGSDADNDMVIRVVAASVAGCDNCTARSAIAISRHPSALMALTRARRTMERGKRAFGFGVEQEHMVEETIREMDASMGMAFALVEATAIGLHLRRIRES